MNEFFHRFGDDESGGKKNEQRFKETGNVFELAVSEGMVAVGGFVGFADRNEGHDCRKKVDPRVDRLRKHGDRTHERTGNDLEYDQREIGNDGNNDNLCLFHGTDRNGVKIVGIANLPGRVPLHASQVYSANVTSLIEEFWDKANKNFVLKLDDEIIKGCLITHGGKIVNEKLTAKPS